MKEMLMRLGLIIPDSALGPIIRLAESLGGRIEGMGTDGSKPAKKPYQPQAGWRNRITELLRAKPGLTLEDIIVSPEFVGLSEDDQKRLRANVYQMSSPNVKILRKDNGKYYIEEGNLVRPDKPRSHHKPTEPIKVSSNGHYLGITAAVVDLVGDNPGLTMLQVLEHPALSEFPEKRLRTAVHQATFLKYLRRDGDKYFTKEGKKNAA